MTTTFSIRPEMSMDALLAEVPGARRALFRGYHIGGCSSCGFSGEETLAQVCARNEGLSVDEVIAYLERAAEADDQVWMEPTEVNALAAGDPPYVLLDIRTAEEFEAAKVPGSIRFSQELMQEALGSWDRTKPVLIIDHTGTRALDAAAYLTGHGFTAVRAMRGGIDRYSETVDSSVPRYTLEIES